MHTDSTLPSWVVQAGQLPVAFAQVREDPWVDAAILPHLSPQPRLVLIASGGCTLAFLAARFPLAHFDVVDTNPAQIALSRLKLRLLQSTDSSDRLALLGHAPMAAEQREKRLRAILEASALPAEAIGPPHIWAEEGPDQAGRYERVFAQLRRELEPHRAEVAQLLRLQEPAEQARRLQPATPLGQALDAAFAQAMDLPILVHLFGEGATRNRVEPFDRHFARQTRRILATLPAADNPYLWQVLAGSYPPAAPAPWLTEPACERLPEVGWYTMAMTEALRQAPRSYDLVHLSNILDWLSEEEAQTTLELAHAALRPGGWTVIRQLNSTLNIPGLGPGFAWQTEQGQALHARDRSYFYRALHVGKKR